MDPSLIPDSLAISATVVLSKPWVAKRYSADFRTIFFLSSDNSNFPSEYVFSELIDIIRRSVKFFLSTKKSDTLSFIIKLTSYIYIIYFIRS